MAWILPEPILTVAGVVYDFGGKGAGMVLTAVGFSTKPKIDFDYGTTHITQDGSSAPFQEWLYNG